MGRRAVHPPPDWSTVRPLHKQLHTANGFSWLLTSNPIPPLLILPPVSLTLTLSSALMGFLIMSCFFRPRRTAKAGSPSDDDTDDIKAETEAAAAAFASAAADDVLLGPNARTWAAIERRRRSTDVSSLGSERAATGRRR
jgi:hypothetical protein